MAFQPVYVVDGARTPFLKAKGAPGLFAASDLAVQAGRSLLTRQPFAPSDLDEVILGCAAPSPDETNIGRMVALRLGCGLDAGLDGDAQLRLRHAGARFGNGQHPVRPFATGTRGGVDALSRAPLLYSDAMVLWFAQMMAARTTGAKLKMFAKLRPSVLLSPVIGLMKGLTDPVNGLLMGQTAENLAWKFGSTRQQMDAFSVRSHQKNDGGERRAITERSCR